MASWKFVLYAVAALVIFVLFLILNFAYLPSRKFTVEHSLSVHNRLTVGGATNIPTTDTAKHEDEELTLEDFKTKTWNCSRTNSSSQPPTRGNASNSICYDASKDPQMCFTDPVHCRPKLAEHPPKHQFEWPKYGEYVYLPKSKWKYIIWNGGVLFLYHPCAPESLVKRLKDLAGSCLRRHVITPYENLDPAQDFAIVTWGCIYSAKKLNTKESREWIRSNAMKAAPAMHFSTTGDFREGLVDPARIVSDIHESKLCPSEESQYNTRMASPKSLHKADKAQDDSDNPRHSDTWHEHVSINENLVIVRGQDGKYHQRHKFDSANAAWALGSLVFLGAILLTVLVYAKPCRQRDYWWRNDDLTYDSNSKFSLLKTRKLFGRGNTRHSTARQKLLTDIPEESDDDL